MIKAIDLYSEEKNYNNCIYEKYECSCKKAWKGTNKVVIYYLDKNEQTEIFNKETEDINEYFFEIENLLKKFLKNKEKLLIAGGHTVINLKDRNFVSKETITSVRFGLDILSSLRDSFKKVDFLIPLNDFFMENDNKTDKNQVNMYRQEALNPYILPQKLKEIFIEKRKLVDFELFFCSEKNMADKFKRHIKNRKKTDGELFRNYGSNLENYSYKLKEREIEVITNNKPNCAAGNAATFRDINYIVNDRKVKGNYDTHIGIYPLCSLDNVIDGYLIGADFYNLNLPTILIFFDRKCY